MTWPFQFNKNDKFLVSEHLNLLSVLLSHDIIHLFDWLHLRSGNYHLILYINFIGYLKVRPHFNYSIVIKRRQLHLLQGRELHHLYKV